MIINIYNLNNINILYHKKIKIKNDSQNDK